MEEPLLQESSSICHVKMDNTSIVGGFIVQFNIKSGNELLWIEGLSPSTAIGIEYKAMPSGLHKIDDDVIYFKHGTLYGLSVYRSFKDSSEERGARMCCIGLLSPSYKELHHRYAHLKQEAHLYVSRNGTDALDKLKTKISKIISNEDTKLGDMNIMGSTTYMDYLVKYEAGSIHNMFQYFGNQSFQLWKALLLQQRLIFYSDVPMGPVCQRVIDICKLISLVSDIKIRETIKPNILFNIGLNDIELLENSVSYIACTSERLFKEKYDLYDVYVDGKEVEIKSPISSTSDAKHSNMIAEALKIAPGDRKRYSYIQLCKQKYIKKTLNISSSRNRKRRKILGKTPIFPEDSHEYHIASETIVIKVIHDFINNTLLKNIADMTYQITKNNSYNNTAGDEDDQSFYNIITTTDMKGMGLYKSDGVFVHAFLLRHGMTKWKYISHGEYCGGIFC